MVSGHPIPFIFRGLTVGQRTPGFWGVTCEVYNSSCGFSWSKVACGTTQKLFPKAVQDPEEENVEAKGS